MMVIPTYTLLFEARSGMLLKVWSGALNCKVYSQNNLDQIYARQSCSLLMTYLA